MTPAKNPMRHARLRVIELSEDPPDWFLAGVAAVKMSQDDFTQDAAWLWRHLRESPGPEDQDMVEELAKQVEANWKTPR